MSGPRVTSALFVSALLRRVQGLGGMATIIARGFDTAGAIHVEWRHRGSVGLLVPAMTVDEDGERRFTHAPVDDERAIEARMESERRFDPESWHVEIEGVEPGSVLTIIDA